MNDDEAVLAAALAEAESTLSETIQFSSKIIGTDDERKDSDDKANFFIRIGAFSSALDVYNKALNVRPKDASLWVKRAALHLKLNNNSKALQDSKHALLLNKAVSHASLVAGHAALSLGLVVDAQRYFKDARILLRKQQDGNRLDENENKDEEEATSNLQQVHEGLRKCNAYLQYCQDGKKWLQLHGDGDGALELSDEALRISNKGREAIHLKMRALLATKRHTEALVYCRPLLPSLSELSILEKVAEEKKSEDHRLIPDPDLAVLFAKALHYSGLYSEAIIFLDAVLTVHPDFPSALYTKEKMLVMQRSLAAGTAAYRDSLYMKAYKEFTAALRLDESHDKFCALVLSNRAAVAMALGKFRSALEDSGAALQRQPDLQHARLRHARALAALGRYKSAVKHFEIVQNSPISSNFVEIELTEVRLAAKRIEMEDQVRSGPSNISNRNQNRHMWDEQKQDCDADSSNVDPSFPSSFKSPSSSSIHVSTFQERKASNFRPQTMKSNSEKENLNTLKCNKKKSNIKSQSMNQNKANLYGSFTRERAQIRKEWNQKQKEKRAKDLEEYTQYRRKEEEKRQAKRERQRREANDTRRWQRAFEGRRKRACQARSEKYKQKKQQNENENRNANTKKKQKQKQKQKKNVNMDPVKNAYAVLGINPFTAGAKEIRKAYKRLALQFHPDKLSISGKGNSDRFHSISNAYNHLKDQGLV
eukprot:g3791.t1